MSETTVNMTPTPPPAQPPAPPPPLLRRSSSDRLLGGVCGGLGRYWNVDPVILRVVFGVSLLLGGVGLFAYLALWWLVPDDSLPGPARITPSWGLRLIGSGAAFIAVMIALGLLFGDSLGNGGVLLGALLAGVVVWIVMSQKPARQPAQTGVAAPPEPGYAYPEPGYAYGGAADYPPTTVLPPPAGPPATPRQSSYLGLVGLCAALAAAGLAMLVSNSPTVILAAPLLVLGVTLLVGAFYGRAKWLLIFAIPLLMLVAAVSQIQQLDLRGPVGEQSWQPTSSGQTYRMTAGSLRVDFSQWRGQPSAADTVAVDMGFGEVQVAAPRNWAVRLQTDLGAGTVLVDGKPVATPQRGQDRREVLIPASGSRTDATITVRVRMGAGEVRVVTGAPVAGRLALVQPEKSPEVQSDKPASVPQTKKEKVA